MCGITVSIGLRPTGGPAANGHANGQANGATKPKHPQAAQLEGQLEKSLELIAHRGPDATGVWVSDDGRIGLGHCRLSINDLSTDGDQPIHSDDGKVHAVVNGEIYDHDRIREEFVRERGYVFRGHSDSELVVALYRAYGAPAFLDHLRGEFALVLYDEATGRTIAARDRFGIKPLYWTETGVNGNDDEERRLLIAAEAKAFLGFGWQAEWDLGGIVEAGWVLDDRSVFKGVKKVLPGYWMEVSSDGEITHHRYWDIDYPDKNKKETRTVDEMIEGVREHLVEATRLRLRADVPVGIYLSGGIDSSVLAGIATELVKEQGVKMGNQDPTKRICCFSIEFPKNSGFDESEIAERTADWLGVQILKKKMDEEQLAKHFVDSAYHCEHHNFDLNSVGKFALSTVPRDNGFKVVLTGEGSDEHFGGYPFLLADFLREPDASLEDGSSHTVNPARLPTLQRGVQEVVASVVSVLGVSPESWNAAGPVNGVAATGVLGSVISLQPQLGLFEPWVRESWEGVDKRAEAVRRIVAGNDELLEKMRGRWHPLHTAEYLWSKSMLANCLLSCLGDRTEMAHSIEARPPFLDHVVSEYVNGLPPGLKIAYEADKATEAEDGGGKGGAPPNPMWWHMPGAAFRTFTEKWILRQAGRQYITQELFERKKHPYSAPARWPRDGPLHRMFKELLTRENVERLGFVDYAIVADALERGFGDASDLKSFRSLVMVGAWVSIGQRFNIKPARKEDWLAARRT